MAAASRSPITGNVRIAALTAIHRAAGGPAFFVQPTTTMKTRPPKAPTTAPTSMTSTMYGMNAPYRALADGLTERGRSVARLIAENASLRDRIADLEQQILVALGERRARDAPRRSSQRSAGDLHPQHHERARADPG